MSKRSSSLRMPLSTRIGRGVVRVFLILWGLTVAFPLIWVLYTSLKSNQEFFASPWALPAHPRWQNFVEAWQEASFAAYFGNSLLTVAVTLAITLLIVGANAYVIAK